MKSTSSKRTAPTLPRGAQETWGVCRCAPAASERLERRPAMRAGLTLATRGLVRGLAIALVLTGCTLTGCTVTSPDPASDSGAAVADGGEPCLRALELDPLGPAPHRVRCPVPQAPPSVAREQAGVSLREIAALAHDYCEQERARISHLSSEAWAIELELARRSGTSPASMRVTLDAFAVRRLDPLPLEAARGCTIEERASEWIARHHALFPIGPDSELRVASVQAGTITYEQRWRGLPVAGSWLALHESSLGFTALEARIVPSWATPPSALPTIDAAAASARADVIVREQGPPIDGAVLLVWPSYDEPESSRLAWRIGGCVIDASDGSLVTCHALNPR